MQDFAAFSQGYQDNIRALQAYARYLYTQGHVAESIHYYKQAIAEQSEATPELLADYGELITALYAVGEFQNALSVVDQGYQQFPEEQTFRISQGVILSMLKQYRKAKKCFLSVYDEGVVNTSLLDGLAYVCGESGDLAGAKEYGKQALALKHEQACGEQCKRKLTDWFGKPFVIEKPIPKFNPAQPTRNIIAFSLWGSIDRYTRNAILNAQMTPYVYPGWTSRFYCDRTVPCYVIDQLLQAGAQVILMPSNEFIQAGLFWRFLVANDQSVDRFLIRDCDSLMNCQERIAVDEWLNSDKYFHVMRNWYSHTDLILAGMWGGVGGVLPNITELVNRFYQQELKDRTIDQLFLRFCIWPLITESVLIHDDYFDFMQPQSYVKQGHFSNIKHHIGQNVTAYAHTDPIYCYQQNFKRNSHIKKCIYTVSTGRCGTGYLAKLLDANYKDAKVFHEQSSPLTLGTVAPDPAQFSLFNQYGNNYVLQKFWRQKFLIDLQGPQCCFAETSHLLCKTGLMENLPLLKAFDAEVFVIDLRRDLHKTANSLFNRADFHNEYLRWMFYLVPDYRNVIIDAKPFLEYGIMGAIIWYVQEIHARGSYYQLLYADHPHIHIAQFDLDEIAQADGAKKLLDFVDGPTAAIALPDKTNAQVEPLFPNDQQLLEEYCKKLVCDTKQLANDFFQQGKHLGMGVRHE